MTKNNFIRLSCLLINASQIDRIVIQNNKYLLHLKNAQVCGYMAFSFGAITSSSKEIVEVCKTKDAIDYEIISKWIQDMP